MTDPRYFYRNGGEENCVAHVSQLFSSLGNRETVSASLTYAEDSVDSADSGVSSACIMAIHNHLGSSKVWKKTDPWAAEVEYTIPHPAGDVTAFDTSSGGDATLSRNSVVLCLSGSCANNDKWKVSLTRKTSVSADKMDLNTQRYSRVKVMNIKRFYYETNRSSWVFKLVVAWEGVTKEGAEASGKRYFVYVETNPCDNIKTSSNPRHSAASFLDKILDIISLDGTRKVLTF